MKQNKDAAEFSALKQYDQFAEWLTRSPFLPHPKESFHSAREDKLEPSTRHLSAGKAAQKSWLVLFLRGCLQ